MPEWKFVPARPIITTPQRNRRYEERAPLREALTGAAVKNHYAIIEWGGKTDPKSASGRRAILRAAAKDVDLAIQFLRWGPSFKNKSIVRVVGKIA